MMNIQEEALKKHKEWRGKIEVSSRVEVDSLEALALAYTPGVAEPCKEIHKDVSLAYQYTRKWNLVAVVSDGTAVLGLGDIGPEAGLPVMEGKAILFKNFAGVDAFPICLSSSKTEDIVQAVKLIAPTFGGINLEDIAAPRCYEVERRLKEELDIPVFHDDQHGTAIVVLAALINSLKLVSKKMEDIKVVINGIGSAGSAIARLLLSVGVRKMLLCDREGILFPGGKKNDFMQEELARVTNPGCIKGDLKTAMMGADVFIGVSAPGLVSRAMVASMNKDAIVFGMANPIPEILPLEAKEAGARIVGSGRSDFPNQVNNVLVFPGIFRGALDVQARDINEEMKVAAAGAIASLVGEDELNEDYVLPRAFDRRVGQKVAEAVSKAAIESEVAGL